MKSFIEVFFPDIIQFWDFSLWPPVFPISLECFEECIFASTMVHNKGWFLFLTKYLDLEDLS